MMLKSRNAPYLAMLAPWMLNMVVLMALPLVAVALLSFYRWDLFGAPVWVGLGNYKAIFGGDARFEQAIRVTLVYTAMYVPTELVGGLLLGLLLHHIAEGDRRGEGAEGVQGVAVSLVRAAVYIPTVLSGVALSLVGMWLFQPGSGLVNGVLAHFGVAGPRWLLDPHVALFTLFLMSLWGLGRAAFLVLAARQMIPTSVYEAALIDGAGPSAIFWRITLPELVPTLAFNLVLGTAATLQSFTGAYVATAGGPLRATLFIVLYIYEKGFHELAFGYAAALSMVVFAASLVISVAMARLMEERA